MSQENFQQRLARISEARGPEPETFGPNGRRIPHSTKATRLERALDIAQRAGIRRTMTFPSVFSKLASMGLPVRPLHYLSPLTLFLLGGALGCAVFGGVVWFFGSPEVTDPTGEATTGMINGGWSGVFIMSVVTGTLFAAIIRFQAVRARLPLWNDI